jgi:hypothetical protein
VQLDGVDDLGMGSPQPARKPVEDRELDGARDQQARDAPRLPEASRLVEVTDVTKRRLLLADPSEAFADLLLDPGEVVQLGVSDLQPQIVAERAGGEKVCAPTRAGARLPRASTHSRL